MSDTMPQIEQLASLLGERLQGVWDALAGRVDELYDMDRLWGLVEASGKEERSYKKEAAEIIARMLENVLEKDGSNSEEKLIYLDLLFALLKWKKAF